MSPDQEPTTFEDEFVSFDEVQEKIKPERSTFEGIKRRGERYLQRGGESLLGIPGDVAQLVRSVAQTSPQGITPEEDLNFIERGGRKLLESLPSTEELRARSAETRPDLEPEDEWEQFEDDIVGDFSTLAIPVKGKIPFTRALGLSLVGNTSKKLMKEMGFGEGAQEATKFGTMLFGGMFGKGRGVKKYIKNLYQNAEKHVPKGATLEYPISRMDNFKKKMFKGGIDDSKTAALEILEEIQAKSPTGKLAVDEAVEFDKRINRQISKASNDKAKKGWLDQLKKVHSEGLDNYAEQNPTWGEYQKDAKQAYSGIAKSENIQNYIKKNANLKNLGHASVILGLGEMALPGHIAEKLGAVGLSASAIYGKEIAKRLTTNPALRRYYQNVMTASLSDNKTMLARNLKGLERVAKKELEENPFPTFELEESFEED